MKQPIVHSQAVAQFIRSDYSRDDIANLRALLVKHGTLSFRPMTNGLYPASQPGSAPAKGGYHYVWVRDNVFVAYAHYLNGHVAASVNTTRCLTAYFWKHMSRFVQIISGSVDASDPMNRVHVRFDGDGLDEIREKWAHAQNDALGYFLWLFCKLTLANAFACTNDDIELLATFAAYFRAIQYWKDEDSGHWEEVRKVSASSIGVVVGALHQLSTLLEANRALRTVFEGNTLGINIDSVRNLHSRGLKALNSILPAECVQNESKKRRLYDAALLFLIYPLRAVEVEMANELISNVRTYLQGDFGIRRYLGDSYWSADYKKLFGSDERTRDFSDDIEYRDALLKEGEEAQWCIFDPIISAIYGCRFIKSRERDAFEQQTFYFNRSLGQITDDLRCPEAYYLNRSRYVPNDNTPLLWTQANLWLALAYMERSLI
jgi:phosphorylase kinase alpha/beta subunit